MRLYELPAAFTRIETILAESEEVPENLAAELDALECIWETKVENVCKMIRRLQADAGAAEAEAARLRALVRVRENTAARLKDYLRQSMVERGLERCETALFKVAVRANSQHTVRVNCSPGALPVGFQRLLVEADRGAMLDAWKNGRVLPAGVSVEQSSHLRIT